MAFAIRSKLKSLLFLLLIGLLLPVGASAQFFTGPAASGAGGAGRAAIDSGEAAFLNPASVGFLSRYYASAYYGMAQFEGGGEHNLWGLSLADGSEGNFISGALSYIRKRVDQGRFSDTQQDLQITLAGAPLKRLSIGIAGHRLMNQILHPSGAGSEYVQLNAHLGLIYVPFTDFGIGFVAYDVLPVGDSVPESVRLVPTHAFGLNYLYEKIFRMRLDLLRPDMKNAGGRVDIMSGMEAIYQENFALRLGGYWQETADRTYFTAGFGYWGPRLSFDYSLQKDVRNGDNIRHLIDLWLTL